MPLDVERDLNTLLSGIVDDQDYSFPAKNSGGEPQLE